MTTPAFNSDEQTEALLGALTLDTQAGFIPPWRHWKGTLVNIRTRYQQTKGNNTMVVIQFQFGNPEFQIIKAVSPINQPNCELEVIAFDLTQIRDSSDLGVFMNSAKKCLGDEAALKFMHLKGKVLEVAHTSGHILSKPFGPADAREYKDVPSDSFEILAVGDKRNPASHPMVGIMEVSQDTSSSSNNGAVGTNDILAVLDGKTLRLFESEAMQLPWVQQDERLFSPLANGTTMSLIVGWLSEGKITREGEGTEAVYHKV